MIREELKEKKAEALLKAMHQIKDNYDDASLLIEEIESRIDSGEFEFTPTTINNIYLFVYLCNKTEHYGLLNKLFSSKKFIDLIDTTTIDGSILPSITNHLTKPRTCLLTSKKLKNSILYGDALLEATDILDDLTKEEITILRNDDLEIDNFLINKGLSFDTLKETTKKRLINDIAALSVYDINTIREFTNSLKDLDELAANERFMDLYLNKLNDEYYDKDLILNHLTIQELKVLLENPRKDYCLLHLVKDTIGETQEYLLSLPKVVKLLDGCNNTYILATLPNPYKISYLNTTKDLFKEANVNILSSLKQTEIKDVLAKNNNYYEDLIRNIKEHCDNLELFINNLPTNLFNDLKKDKINEFDIKSIISLLAINPSVYKHILLANKELCSKLYSKINLKTFNQLLKLFEIGKFTIDDKITFLNNINEFKNNKILMKVVEEIPLSSRRIIYNNELIRDALLSNDKYKLDEYSIKYLQDHPEELNKFAPNVIITALNNGSTKLIDKALNDQEILDILFENMDESFIRFIINTIKINNKYITKFNDSRYIKYYNKEIVEQIIKGLNIHEKNEFCTNELIKHILNDDELLKIYRSLLNKNCYLLNTINFNYLNDSIKPLKLSINSEITKYPEIEESIIEINKQFKILPTFVNNIFYNIEALDLKTTVKDILNVIKESTLGINRKIYGNIPKMLGAIDITNISKEDFIATLNYLLYLVPRFANPLEIKRPVYIKTPSTYNEIKTFTKDNDAYLTKLIASSNDTEVLDYFLAKHFKLTYEEALYVVNKYSIARIDETIYKEEYEYLNNLNRIINTDITSLKEMDKNYKVITMFDSFKLINSINKMYAKIFNFEIRSKTYSNNPFIKTIYGKELKIFECPNDFFFLISNMDLRDELKTTYSYFEAWHNKVNKIDTIPTSLISNDNLVLRDDITFGFNGVLDTGIMNMYSTYSKLEKETYYTPRELIDNTRDINNTINLDKFAIRPKYNNSNIPNIEPDYILVDKSKLDDKTYLELISRIKDEFKTKRNKDGLPIIAIDKDKIATNEINKINLTITKYNKTHDMELISSIITKLENNYTAYRTYALDIAKIFSPDKFIKTIMDRIGKSNSVSELNFILETLEYESNKFNKLPKHLACSFDLKLIKDKIKERKLIILN